jgi:NADH-quinone oxidoreductase subunit I
MKALADGLFTVFKHLFMKPVTLEYPEKKRELSDAFRGKMVADTNTGEHCCIGCGVCKKVCPSGAISYEKNEEGKVVSYSFDLKKCIFCGNCMYYCPRGAINMTKEYELGCESKENLILTYKKEGEDD